jgi:hypothetical protein
MTLSLNDPRWAFLHTRNGDGASIPRWLSGLLQNPDDLDLFQDEACGLSSGEEITYSAAFAAAPYLMEVARRAGSKARLEYVSFLGMIAQYRLPPGEPLGECPPDLEPPYQQAVTDALDMALAMLRDETSEPSVRVLLADIAAFKGFAHMANRIIEIKHDLRQDPPVQEIPF